MRWAGHLTSMEDKIGANRVLVGSERKKPLGRTRCRCEDKIKMDLQKVRWGGIDSTDLAQYKERRRALVNAVMNLRVP